MRSVSCVIPVFNGERFLAEALDSVLSQTVPVTEIVVVDDGSTDDTAGVVARYPAVTYARQDQAGAPAARNHGIRLASGEFVALLDADDLWLESKLERQLGRFAERPGLGASLTHMQNFWVEALGDEARRLAGTRLAQPQPGSASTVVIRRALFERVGYLNEQVRNRDLQDWLLRAEKLGIEREVLPDVLVRRRIHESNVSRRRSKEELFDLLKSSLRKGNSSDGDGQ